MLGNINITNIRNQLSPVFCHIEEYSKAINTTNNPYLFFGSLNNKLSALEKLGLGSPRNLLKLTDSILTELLDFVPNSYKHILFHLDILSKLLAFFVQSVFAAETTELLKLKSVRIVLLVFFCVIISLLAFSANQCNFDSHSISAPPNRIRVLPVKYLPQCRSGVTCPRKMHTKKALRQRYVYFNTKNIFCQYLFENIFINIYVYIVF